MQRVSSQNYIGAKLIFWSKNPGKLNCALECFAKVLLRHHACKYKTVSLILFFCSWHCIFLLHIFKSPLSKTVGMHDMKQSFSPTAILLYSTRFFMDPWYKKSCFNLHNLCKVEANKRKYAKHVENFSIFICNLSQLWG